MRVLTLMLLSLVATPSIAGGATDGASDGVAIGATFGTGLDDTLIQSGDISAADSVGADLYFEYDFAEALKILNVSKTLFNVHFAQARASAALANNEIDVMGVSALWRWQSRSGVFFDAGVGLAYLSEDTFLKVKMGSQENFVLDFALGYQFSSHWDMSLRYRHYSNGYTQSPNPGLDFAVAQVNYWF